MSGTLATHARGVSRSVLRRGTVIFAVSSALALSAIPAASPALASSYPGFAHSHYMNTVDGSTLYTKGCTLGGKVTNGTVPSDALVVLDFGPPARQNTTYGALYWLNGHTFATTAQIANAVEQYGHGFYNCTSHTPVLSVAAGVSSDSSVVGTAHGAAWANMIHDINAWFIAQGYSSQVIAYGAIDAESQFASTPGQVRGWADGFGGAGTGSAYFDFGSAAGCSFSQYGTTPPGRRCDPAYNGNDDWYQDDVWYVSWGASPALALPEIYNETTVTLPDGNTSDHNAQAWEMLRLYGNAARSNPIAPSGSMTQYQACIDVSDPCSGTDNDPLTGWTHLHNSLAAYTPAKTTLRWATDIRWGF